jgi:hypothetical protein
VDAGESHGEKGWWARNNMIFYLFKIIQTSLN